MNAVSIEPVALDDPRAQSLLSCLLHELAARYGEHVPMSPTDAADFAPPRGLFVVALLEGRPVGCGGYRRFDATTAELKRLFVSATHRGSRVGGALLDALESSARDSGYDRLVLETGDRQPEAVRLYERCGYARIALLPPYEGQAWSLCFGKSLAR